MRLKFPRFDPSAFSRLTFKPPEQQHLSKLVRELESSQSTLPPPERERIEKIIARFREHFDEDLSTLKDRFLPRELRSLCYGLSYGRIPLLKEKWGMKALELIEKYFPSPRRSLPGLVISYANLYGLENENFEFLRLLILHRVGTAPETTQGLRGLKAVKNGLFHKDADSGVGIFLFNTRTSPMVFFNEAGIPPQSPLAHEAVKSVIRQIANAPDFTDRIKIFLEDLTADSAPNVAVSIANAFLASAEEDAFESTRDPIRRFLLCKIGDPRWIVDEPRWHGVSAAAKKIFGLWLNTEDLDFFFDVVEKTTSDPKFKYRRAFWEAYLPSIDLCRACLGRTAKNLFKDHPYIKEREQSLAWVTGGFAPDHSLFLIKIKDFIILESSTGRACYIYLLEEAPISLEATEYRYDRVLIRDLATAWFPHIGSDYYRWQSQIECWLHEEAKVQPSKSYRIGRIR